MKKGTSSLSTQIDCKIKGHRYCKLQWISKGFDECHVWFYVSRLNVTQVQLPHTKLQRNFGSSRPTAKTRKSLLQLVIPGRPTGMLGSTSRNIIEDSLHE